MAKKHLPKSVFEVGSTAVARIHLATGKPMAAIAESIWAEYASQCEDASAKSEMAASAESILKWVLETKLPSPQHLLRHLQYFCQAYEDNGDLKKKRLLDGLWFQPDTYDLNRAQVYLQKAQVYCASAGSGLVPLAPDSYR